MAAPLCAACARPLTDTAMMCSACTDITWSHLREVRDLAAELILTLTRQDRIGDESEGGRSSEIPLPWKEPAAEAASILHATLLAWVKTLSQATGGQLPAAAEPGRYDRTVDLAKWILRHRDTFRRHSEVVAAADEIQDAVRLARRSIDRPMALVYRGPCAECRADLYCQPSAEMIVCRSCGRCYDAAERRAWLVRQLESGSATATESARGVSALLGIAVSPNLIHKWASRGRLVPSGRDRQGRPLYRLADVISLATVGPQPRDTMSPAS